jgi:hypothetical protein
MPLPEPEHTRLQMLLGRLVSEPYVEDYYGISGLLQKADLLEDLERYRGTLEAPPAVPAASIDRYVLEGFFGASGVLPLRWAAARMGLQPPMLQRIIQHLDELPLPRAKRYLYFECLVDKDLSEDMVRYLPELRFRTFSDHESFCRQLHKALMQVLGISEEDMHAASLWCETDRELSNAGMGEYPRRYGYHFDCLTCQPLSSAHALWLDLGKPLSLAPDRCSRLFFARYRDDLNPYVRLGRNPREDLERYEEYIQQGH